MSQVAMLAMVAGIAIPAIAMNSWVVALAALLAWFLVEGVQ